MTILNQVQELLNKHFVIPFYLIVLLSLFSWLRGCSTAKENTRLRKEVNSLSSEVDSINKVISDLPKLEDIQKEFQIEGYRISKRTLYDQNAIVRTKVRPDDRMNEYDQKIEELQSR